jgi:DnaJ-class molecular chaperone
MTESGISSSTHGDDSLLLGALLILRQQLEECRAQFGGGTLSYEAAKARVAELKEQAEVLISPSASSETEQVSAEETHYAILGVARTATQEEVRKAYREKQRRLHPDTIAAWAKDEVPQEVKDFLNENAKRLNLAYQILSDPKKRKDYDASIERRTSDG